MEAPKLADHCPSKKYTYQPSESQNGLPITKYLYPGKMGSIAITNPLLDSLMSSTIRSELRREDLG
jgi:hypothetical protein